MSCDGNSELLMELEDFMEEVETIDHQGFSSTSPPTSDWLVHFDPLTKQTVYRHIVSGEERQEMPAEYATYLERFNQFMKCYSTAATVTSANDGGSPVERSESDETSPLPRPPRRRRKHKISHCDGHSETKCLSGLISYSASSDSDIDPESEAALSPDVNFISRLDISEPTTLIGPQLPKHLTDDEGTNGEDIPVSTINATEVVTSEPDDSDIPTLHPVIAPAYPLPASPLLAKEKEGVVPVSPPSPILLREKFPNTETKKKKFKRDKKKKHRDKHYRTESHLEDMVEAMKDKFAAFNVCHSEVSTLHCLYIQMNTRLEDWRCGKLSSHYVTKKLNELESRLSSVTTDDLPHNWTFHWDTNSQRYYYHNKETKVTQWTFPEHRPVSSPPITTPNATIIRSPQLLLAKENNVIGTELKHEGPAAVCHSSEVSTFSSTSEKVLQSSGYPPPVVASCHLSSNLPDPEHSVSSAISEIQITPETDPTDVDSANTNEEWLNEQLQEFAIACLEFSSPNREDILNGNPLIDDLPPSTEGYHQQSEHPPSDSGLPGHKPSTKKKKPVSATKSLSNVSKGLPQLIQKWQRLQESL